MHAVSSVSVHVKWNWASRFTLILGQVQDKWISDQLENCNSWDSSWKLLMQNVHVYCFQRDSDEISQHMTWVITFGNRRNEYLLMRYLAWEIIDVILVYVSSFLKYSVSHQWQTKKSNIGDCYLHDGGYFLGVLQFKSLKWLAALYSCRMFDTVLLEILENCHPHIPKVKGYGKNMLDEKT